MGITQKQLLVKIKMFQICKYKIICFSWTSSYSHDLSPRTLPMLTIHNKTVCRTRKILNLKILKKCKLMMDNRSLLELAVWRATITEDKPVTSRPKEPFIRMRERRTELKRQRKSVSSSNTVSSWARVMIYCRRIQLIKVTSNREIWGISTRAMFPAICCRIQWMATFWKLMIWFCNNKFQDQPNLRRKIIFNLTIKCHSLIRIKLTPSKFLHQVTSTVTCSKRSKMTSRVMESNFWSRAQVFSIWNQLNKGIRLIEVVHLLLISIRCKQMVILSTKRNLVTKLQPNLPHRELVALLTLISSI